MTLELMLKTLLLIGFFQADAEIYLHLTIEGPKHASAIAATLNMPRRQVYRSLKNLTEKRIVNAHSKRPQKFSATPFEEVLDMFKEATLHDAQRMEQNKTELLSAWHDLETGKKQNSGTLPAR
jgi:sugar-specific transcriptional regulator TrmB